MSFCYPRIVSPRNPSCGSPMGFVVRNANLRHHTQRLSTTNLGLHPAKVESWMVTDSERLILSKDLHFAKANSPIAVTDSGIVMLLKELHLKKAPSPITVTASGIVMLTKELHFLKAPSPMAMTDSGNSDAHQRTAPFEGTFSNGRNRPRESDAFQRNANLRRHLHEWLSQSQG